MELCGCRDSSCLTYFTCGWMDVMVGTMRGIGYSLLPMVVSLAGACGLRVVWDLYDFSVGEVAADLVYLLSGILGYHGGGTYTLFLYRKPQDA